MAAQINKIYDLKIVGADTVIKQMNDVNNAFDANKKTFQDLKAILGKGGLNTSELSDYQKKLEASRIEGLKLKTAQQDLKNESIAYKNALEQEKNQQKLVADGNKYVANSYNDIAAQKKKLLSELKGNVAIGGLNTQELQETTAHIRVLEDQIRAFNRSLSSEGTNVGEYSRGIIKAFKDNGLDSLIKNQIDKTKASLLSLDTNFAELKAELSNIKVTGTGSFEKIEAEMIQNRQEAEKLKASLSSVETELRGTGNIGQQVSTGLRESFKSLKGDLVNMAVGFVGFQAAFSGIQTMIHGNIELSDSLADLQIRLHGNKEAADEVFNSLKKLDTRTSIGELIDTASLVAKKGVAKEEITGITKALDDYFVVAGKEAGSREEGVSSIVKLISIFNDDKHVTKERVQELTSALVGLQNSGVATGEYLVGFAERVGSVRGLTGIAIPGVLGLGAAFQQLGQSQEVAGTASIQILTKIFGNVPKYAKAAGVSIEEFRKLLKDNPFEALVKVGENLKGNGTKNLEEVAKDFQEVGVNGARLKAALADIATNADFVRKRMKDAGVQMKDFSSLTDATEIKQNDFAATIDKIGNSFKIAFSNDNFRKTLEGIADALLFLVKLITSIPFGILITGVTLLTSAWAFYKGNVIATTIAQQWNNQATLLGTLRNAAARLGLLGAAEASRVKAAALAVETEATEAATVATEELNMATKVSPLGIILGIIALLIPAMYAFGRSTSETTTKLNEQNKSLKDYKKFQDEIDVSIKEQTTKTKNSIDELISIIKDENNSLELRKQAYEALIKIAPEFTGTLDDEYRATDKLNTVYDKYIQNLNKVARAKAIQNVKQKHEDDLAKAQVEEFQLKLKAVEEDNKNAEIRANNKARSKNYGQVAAATPVSVEEQTHVLDEKESTEANDAWNKQHDKVLSLLEEDKSLNAWLNSFSEEDKKALISGITTNNDNGETEKEKRARLKKEKEERTDAFNEEDAKHSKAIAELEKWRAELESQNKYDLDAQRKYATALERIDEAYYQGKINFLQKHKSLNALEQKDLAEFQLKKVEAKLKYNKAINEIDEKSFKEREEAIKEIKLDSDNKATEKRDSIKGNVNATPTELAQADIQYHQELLNNVIHFNAEMDNLEKELNIKSKKNLEERQKLYDDANKSLIGSNTKLIEAESKTIEEKYKKYSNNDKIDTGKAISIIFDDNTTDPTDKLQKVEEIKKNFDKREQQRVINQSEEELALLDKEYAKELAMYVLFGQKMLISEAEYLDKKAALEGKIGDAKGALQQKDGKDNSPKTLKGYATKALSGLFKSTGANDKQSDDAAATVMSSAYEFAQTAMQAYFDAERQNIENSLKLAERRIDAEERVALGHAQSAAEQDTIERQAAAKKLAAQKEAFDKEKKLKKAQAAMSFAGSTISALEQANKYPFPADLIIFGILEAFNAATYGIQLAAINRQQFKKGGLLKRYDDGGNVPASGGEFGGNPHSQGGTPFAFQGQSFEAEAKELAIINKNSAQDKSVYNVTGNPKQIASMLNQLGGGTPFSSGGILKKYAEGGYLGSNVQPPVFRSYYQNSSVQNNYSEERLQRIENMVSENTKQIAATDAKKTYVVSREITKQQKTDTSHSQIGRL